ncbi:hypothetical protein NP493_2043g00013 [Ridgeia piscesae]|uniref:Uncharacterized protein n=1 Tax=Ridgeia piscesae TaxID=27915 RepID=A0AAD9JNN9_RIDPI|nr:hypothetical protein NP493_2043g00013 [Ridgeia piscesae]
MTGTTNHRHSSSGNVRRKDVIEIVKKGCEQQWTAHLNTIDTRGNIKFTHEEESEGSLPFLDTFMVQKEDGAVKLLVYRKKTHADQYLNFNSHRPLYQKLGVIKNITRQM